MSTLRPYILSYSPALRRAIIEDGTNMLPCILDIRVKGRGKSTVSDIDADTGPWAH